MRWDAFLIGAAALALLALAASSGTRAQENVDAPAVEIELNKSEEDSDGCSLYFVAKNQGSMALEELRLEFIVFDKHGSISRRLVANLGPLNPTRTTVKVFKTADKCEAIDGLLINSAKACGSRISLVACLENIKTSSRASIKLFM